ncbi:MAG TPA: sigma-70 family RNA polymerase sigma factor [Thermoanaerobaculia bacterium]|nr:sigma-70 family RNA polymerase sigma factor [Thermoanaerobaculia bacterium]
MDADNFAELVDRYQDSLVNYLWHLTRSRDRAEEIAQDAFVRLYRSIANCREDSIAPYLFRIATNAAISEIRRERRWKLLLPMLTAAHPSSEAATDRVASDEIRSKVAAALDKLPVKFRAPLVLYEIEEWPYQEIARALGCRIGTIKSRISRARALLRVELEPWWIGGDHDRERNWRCDAAPAASEGVAPIQV